MSATSLRWVVSAYVIGYGGFMLLGGRLADLFPPRRLLLVATLIFAAAASREER
jgi:MFS family permease